MENVVAQAWTQGEYPIKKDWSYAATAKELPTVRTEAGTEALQAPLEEAGLYQHLDVRTMSQ